MFFCSSIVFSVLYSFFLIGVGGAVGAMARYAIFLLAKNYLPTHFPFGVLMVNAGGSFLIGLLLGVSLATGFFVRLTPLHFFWITGFLGAFTTFSTFSEDTWKILLMGNVSGAFLNIFLNITLCLLLTAGGYMIGKAL